MAKSAYSTVAISPEDKIALDDFCRRYGLTRKEFVSVALSYFRKEGINPKIDESPQSEIAKITKRIDQFFAFFKKQEQEYIRPLLIEMGKISNQIDNLAELEQYNSKNHHHDLQQIIYLCGKLSEIDNLKNLTAGESGEIKQGLEQLLSLIDQKNKSGLFGNLFK